MGSNTFILSVVASILQRLVVRNERLLSPGKILSRAKHSVFSATLIPAMSIAKYLERIFKYAHCSPSAFVVAYAYIDRLLLSNPNFLLTSLNVHRLLITSVMAVKFLDDLHYNNCYFAKVGGITLREINSQEVEFLFMLRFRLQVTVSVFECYCLYFQREVGMGRDIQIERSHIFL